MVHDGYADLPPTASGVVSRPRAALRRSAFRLKPPETPPPPEEPRADCVIYARYSSQNGAETSIERQVQMCEAYAAQNNWSVATVYVDRKRSGTTEANRPEFAAMKRAGEQGLFHRLLTERVDRLHRDEADQQVTRKEFERWNIEIHEAAGDR